MISEKDLEAIGKAIEAEFPGVKAHFRRESVHQFMRGIGLEIEGRRDGFIVRDDQDEASLVDELRRWCRKWGMPKKAKNLKEHEAEP
jgi:hypothetical protein